MELEMGQDDTPEQLPIILTRGLVSARDLMYNTRRDIQGTSAYAEAATIQISTYVIDDDKGNPPEPVMTIALYPASSGGYSCL